LAAGSTTGAATTADFCTTALNPKRQKRKKMLKKLRKKLASFHLPLIGSAVVTMKKSGKKMFV
jgi:precorrin-3B methylase